MYSTCERIIGKGAKKGKRCDSSKIKGGFCAKCLKLKEVTETLEFGCRFVSEKEPGNKIRCGKEIDELGLCTDCLNNRGYISLAYKPYMLYNGDDTKCRGVKLSGTHDGTYCGNICDPETKICSSCSKKKTYENLIRDNFYRQSTTPSDRLYNLSQVSGIEQNSSCAQDADNFSSKTKNTDPSDNNNNNNDDISSPAKAAKNRNSKQTIPPNKKSEIWTTYVGNLHKSKCFCCWKTPIESTSFSAGHIHPESDGGSLNILNLRPICVSCNASMGTNNMFVYMLQKKTGGWSQALESCSIEIYLHILCSESKRYSASLEEFHSDYSKWCDEQNTPALSMTVVKYYLIGLTMYDINTERMTLNHKMLQ